MATLFAHWCRTCSNWEKLAVYWLFPGRSLLSNNKHTESLTSLTLLTAFNRIIIPRYVGTWLQQPQLLKCGFALLFGLRCKAKRTSTSSDFSTTMPVSSPKSATAPWASELSMSSICLLSHQLQANYQGNQGPTEKGHQTHTLHDMKLSLHRPLPLSNSLLKQMSDKSRGKRPWPTWNELELGTQSRKRSWVRK